MSTTEVKPFAWSFSQLKNFETCSKRYYHYNVAKDVVEPSTPQLDAGNALHKHFEDRLVKGTPLPLGYGMYEKLLAKIVAAPGALYGEQKLAINANFEPRTYFARDVWLRTVADAAKVLGDRATIFDWKTGKPSDDETQLKLNAATMFAHAPELRRVRAALVFLGHNATTQAEYDRDDLPEIWSEIMPRVRAMAKARQDQEYPPRPSGLCKRYCAVVSCPYFGKGGR
jgi:hypothetical protein